ncbi:MAG: hypothetical protein GX537_08215, partial [Actinobacteria bacterium]|nr:hypothetical protein [Actinomycetota bacterium]
AVAAVFVGLQELPADRVRVRRLAGGEEVDLEIGELAAWFAGELGKAGRSVGGER